MRFLLAFVLSFVSVFAIAQSPPMKVGGPQGIDVTKALITNWLSIPTYIDTPVTNPGLFPWPGKGYIVQVVKTGDTSVWQYTGQRWSRIGGASQELFTRLITGGNVNRIGDTRDYNVSTSTYIINGVNYVLSTPDTVTSASKTPNVNGRIDVIALSATGAEIVQGAEAVVPIKPSIGPNRIELSAIYYRAFDTVPSIIGSGISSVYRIPGRDSLYFASANSVIAVKDSIGISKNDTAAMLNPYKFTAANGLTRDSTVFRLGGSLNQNTNINLNARRLTFIGGSDTTRIFANGSVSIGGIPDSTNRLLVRGDARVNGILRLAATSPSNAAIIRNENSNDGSLAWVGNSITLPSNFGNRNVIISPCCGYSSLTSASNTLIGSRAGTLLTTGGFNTFIGHNAGGLITTGANNTFIGGQSGAGDYPSSTSNAIHLTIANGPSNALDTPLLGLTSRYAMIGGGTVNTYTTDFYFGGGHRVQLPNDAHINFYAPSGWPSKADTIGSNFTINAGRGTGAGVGGSIIFRTSSATTSGTTLQTLSERVRISHRGNLLVGTATDDTSSLVNIVSTTKGFLQPRMENTQRDAITTPATGLQLFSTTDSANYVYRGTGGGWQKIANEISGSATLDFPSTNNGNENDLTITVTGASEGDVVSLGIPNSVNLAHSCFTAWVSATNTVTVRFNNYGTGSLDPVSATFKVKVFK